MEEVLHHDAQGCTDGLHQNCFHYLACVFTELITALQQNCHQLAVVMNHLISYRQNAHGRRSSRQFPLSNASTMDNFRDELATSFSRLELVCNSVERIETQLSM
jgi:hypothetical protein